MDNILPYLKIARPINLIITFFTVIIATIICGADKISLELISGALSLTFVFAYGYIINDVFDLEIDKINRPDRALPSGKISLKEAKIYYLLVLLFSYIFAIYAGTSIIIFNSILIVFLYLYSYKLKSMVLWGNILVAAITASAFILGGMLTNNLMTSLIPAGFAFQVNLIREIIKDIEDIKGDKANNAITFAGKYGLKNSIKLVLSLIVILIISTTIPFIYKIYKIEYLIIVMLSVNIILIYIIYLLKKNNAIEQIKKVSGLLKLSMIFGLLAIYFGI